MILVILYWLCLSEFIRRQMKKVSTSWKPFLWYKYKRGILLFYICNFNDRISIINLHLQVLGGY